MIKEKLQAKSQAQQEMQLKELESREKPPEDPDSDSSADGLQVVATIDAARSASVPSLSSAGNPAVNNKRFKSSSTSSLRDELKLESPREGSESGKSRHSSTPHESSPVDAKRTEPNTAHSSEDRLEGRNEKADTKRRKSVHSSFSEEDVFEASNSTALKYAPSSDISERVSGKVEGSKHRQVRLSDGSFLFELLGSKLSRKAER